jgi:hypothetical protein
VKAPPAEAFQIESATVEAPVTEAPELQAAVSAAETHEIDAPAAESPVANAVAPAPAIDVDEEPRSDTIDSCETKARVDDPLPHEPAADDPTPSASEMTVAPTDAHEADAPTAEPPIMDSRGIEAVSPAIPTGVHESVDVPEMDSTNLVEAAEAEANPTDAPIAAPSEVAATDIPAHESVVAEMRVSDDPDAHIVQVAPSSEAVATAEPAVEAAAIEHDRIAAREIKAKWMRAHELDELAVEMAAAKARQAKPAAPIAPALEEPALESSRGEAPLRAEPAREVPEVEAATAAVAALPEADEFARIEPTFDRPMMSEPEPAATPPEPEAATTADAGSATALRGIALPSIETRIERRRFSTLRAEPQLAVRHPLFPEIEPDAWDVPPAVAARAKREPRGGTGWAIGLGTVLLIIGVTAPAAIWQGQRSAQTEQDQVALLTPSPAPANTTSQATLPEPPQPAATPAPSPAQPAPAEQVPADQASLSAMQDGGEVAATPIFKPPVPQLETASKQATQVDAGIAGASVAFPPVARPFVPEGQPGPFLTPPSNGAQTASVALRPNLMAQLKPKAPAGVLSAPAAKPAATAARKVVQKPKSQSPQRLDQMFQTLIDTLSEGQPVNPANKPVPPSTRR